METRGFPESVLTAGSRTKNNNDDVIAVNSIKIIIPFLRADIVASTQASITGPSQLRMTTSITRVQQI